MRNDGKPVAKILTVEEVRTIDAAIRRSIALHGSDMITALSQVRGYDLVAYWKDERAQYHW